MTTMETLIVSKKQYKKLKLLGWGGSSRFINIYDMQRWLAKKHGIALYFLVNFGWSAEYDINYKNIPAGPVFKFSHYRTPNHIIIGASKSSSGWRTAFNSSMKFIIDYLMYALNQQANVIENIHSKITQTNTQY